MALDKEEFTEIPGTVVFDMRTVAQRLLAQPVLHVADEGREPHALQGQRRAYLDEWRMSEEQKQAVLAPHDLNLQLELGGNIYFLAQDRRGRRQELPADGRQHDRHDRAGIPRHGDQGRPNNRRESQNRRGRPAPAGEA